MQNVKNKKFKKLKKKKSILPTGINPFRTAFLEAPKQQLLLVTHQPSIPICIIGR